MGVFVHSHISLLVARLSSSRLQIPTPTDLLVLFNQGIKSFQDSNYNDRLSAGSDA